MLTGSWDNTARVWKLEEDGATVVHTLEGHTAGVTAVAFSPDPEASRILTGSEDPILSELLLVPIMGESRAAFVYPRQGRAGVVRDYLEGAFPGWFTILDSVQALEAGLMGTPIADETYARAGQLLVLPRGSHALQRAQPETNLLGRHGGFTPEEMLVPLIAARLDALPIRSK